jgi:hypothetical protein
MKWPLDRITPPSLVSKNKNDYLEPLREAGVVVDLADGAYRHFRRQLGPTARAGPCSSLVGERSPRQVDRTSGLLRR